MPHPSQRPGHGARAALRQALTRRQLMLTTFGGALAVGLAACSDQESSTSTDLTGKKTGAMDQFAVGTQFTATTAFTLPLLFSDNPGYPEKDDWLLWSKLTELTNVTLEPTIIPMSDYEQKRSLMIGAGTAPFLIPKTYPGQETSFVSSGAVLPVSDYVQYMPNFQDKLTKWGLQSDVDALIQTDGKYYVLPGLHEEVWPDYTLAARTDLLTKHGLDTPATWDELHTVLAELKKIYPDSTPLSDRFNNPTPGGNLLGIMSAAYGTAAGWAYTNARWVPASGEFVLSGAMDEYRDMLTFLNTLVNEGLLDKESFTQDDDTAVQKFVTGESFFISTNAQNIVNDYRSALAEKVSGGTVAKIPVPTGPAGDVISGSRLECGLMISADAAQSENFLAMLQFIDWLWYSDDGEVFAKWGVEGTTYTTTSDGGFQLADDVDYVGLNPDADKHLQKDFGFSCGNFAYGGSTELLQSTFSDEEIAFQEAMATRTQLDVPPPYPFTEVEKEQATLLETTLKDYVGEMTLKFILGQRSLDEWDTYKSELEAKSGTEYIEMVNTAYQRYAEGGTD